MSLREQIAQYLMNNAGFTAMDRKTVESLAFDDKNPRALMWWKQAGDLVQLVRSDARNRKPKN